MNATEDKPVSKETGKRAKKQLTHGNFYKLCEFLKRVDSHHGAGSHAEVAARAEKALAIPVSLTSVRDAFQTINVVPGYMERALDRPHLYNDLIQLAAFVAKMAADLGIEVPDNIRRIFRLTGSAAE